MLATMRYAALRLLPSLEVAISEISKAEVTSNNQFVTTALAERVCTMKTAEFLIEHASQADIEAASCLLGQDVGRRPQPEDRVL